MSEDEFEITGHEVVEKQATPHGNGAKVIVPKDWRGETVKIVRTTDGDGDDDVELAPLCVLLLDKLETMDQYNFRELLRYATRYKAFSDVPNTVVEDFEYCIEGPNTVDRLIEVRNNTSFEPLTNFYQDLIDNHDSETLIATILKQCI
jgi:putative transposon-encoded protein